MIKKIINAISIVNRKMKYKKYFYSFNAVDIVVDYIFKNNKSGFYLDVGAQHPISNNNTYLLYKRGWKGINIDLDKKNISINTPYNISSFETSPSKWRDTINSLGYKLKIDYEVDFRQDIADSWPKKVDDSLLRKDIDWIPKFNEKETALDILKSI